MINHFEIHQATAEPLIGFVEACRRFGTLALAAVLLFATLSQTTVALAATSSRKPNLIFIMADDEWHLVFSKAF